MTKKKKTRRSEKERATDIPRWAAGQFPLDGESGKDFAERLLDEKYGKAQYPRGPKTEFNRLQKYGDRHKKVT